MAATKAKKKDTEEESKVVAFENPEEGDGQPEGKKKKKEKKKGGFKRFVFLLIFLAGAGAFLYFSLTQDWGGVRTKLIHAVSSLDPNYRTLNQKIEEYNLNQKALEEAQTDLETAQAALTVKEESLSKQETDIKVREANLAPIYLQGLSEEKIKELTQLGDIYTAMEPEVAADIMSRLYHPTHIALIIYHMGETAAAEVLSAMNRDLAAKVTSELLRT